MGKLLLDDFHFIAMYNYIVVHTVITVLYYVQVFTKISATMEHNQVLLKILKD